MPAWLLIDMPATESITVYTITVFIGSLNGVMTCMTSRKKTLLEEEVVNLCSCGIEIPIPF